MKIGNGLPVLLCLLALLGCGAESPEPELGTVPEAVILEETPPPRELAPEEFVPVGEHIPGLVVELRYATENNFTRQVIYDFDEAWLRWGTVEKLRAVQAELEAQGLGLKLWDGFRPPEAQFVLWQAYPDPAYVANPTQGGYSSHSRGNTVDVTLVDGAGRELEMPTGFDDFSPLADRDYGDCSQTARENALLLEGLMEKHGFRPYFAEWWHYSDTDPYPVETVFTPS